MGEIPDNDEIGVPEFLERCVGGLPLGVSPSVAIAGHRIAWARFQETGDAEWREVADYSVRAITFARTATTAESALTLQYLQEIPVAAWFTATGWSRRRVRSHCIADAKRWVSVCEDYDDRDDARDVARDQHR
jgi:hypothetical protein